MQLVDEPKMLMHDFGEADVIGVIAHDAGAAAHIASYVSTLKNKVLFTLAGPAVGVFSDFYETLPLLECDMLVAQADLVICGTGWQTDLEWRGISLCQKMEKPVVACIDHWTNYESRFVRNGLQVLPSEIWVFDIYANELANSMFPTTVVCQHPNLYLERQVKIVKDLDDLNQNRSPSILYLLEPMRECWSGEEPAEFEALDHFISNVDSISTNAAKIYLKLHPSDPPGKYDNWISRHQHLNITIKSGPLAEAISQSDVVVGCRTYAMVIALYSGRTVYTSIPKSIQTFRLPYESITQF
jgi:hypothetical protein